MSAADALLNAVIAAPADDLPRLVYADWLDDHGDHPRAEFVRVQCATAAGDAGLRVREAALLAAHLTAWLAPLRVRGGPLFNRGTHAQFRRGFVEVVWMPAGLFVAKAHRLFAAAPVRELRVTRAAVAELADLVASPAVGRLDALDLSDRRFGADVGRLLADSRHVAGLTVLRLRNCGLTDESALRLADAAFDWPLRELDVGLNPIGPAAVEALRERFGGAVRAGG